MDALKSVLGIQRDDDPPKEVLDLFKEKLYNVESTINTIFASGGLQGLAPDSRPPASARLAARPLSECSTFLEAAEARRLIPD